MRKARIWMTSLAAAALLVAGAGIAPAGGDSAMGTGKVNAVKAEEHKINVTHEPIPELGWPGMTMDFPVADSVSLEGLEPGSKIEFHVHKTGEGMYEIDSLKPTDK